MNPADENVLVIRRRMFDELGAFQGLSFEPEKYLKAILSRGSNFFIARPQAESDPAYKQIIPYALIAFQNSVLHYVRGKKAGEQRLIAKGSIGIGGHMNEADESLFAMDDQAYRAGVEREVADRGRGVRLRSRGVLSRAVSGVGVDARDRRRHRRRRRDRTGDEALRRCQAA